MTVVWHVDDLEVSHVYSFEITKFACYLDNIYCGLSVKRGKVYNYLGVDLYFSIVWKVQVSMIHYLNNILRDFPEYLVTVSASPADDHLFKVRSKEEARLLPEEQALLFHLVVEQILFIGSRYRRGIQTAVDFLTTSVKQPDKDDWGKLKRVMRFLKVTRGLKLNLSIDYIPVFKWLVDASYDTHE